MRRATSIALLALLLATVHAQPARASDCPPVGPDTDAVSADCLNAEVPTVDADGDPIPYVEEVIAPDDGTALTDDQ